MNNLFINTFNCYPYEYFFENSDNMPKIDNYIAFDFFNIFCSIYYSDIMTSISGSDGGHRNIKIDIPVSDLQTWNDNKSIIEKIAKFMSEDNWDVTFLQGNYSFKECLNIKKPLDYKNVSLYSGGLDSLAGAYNNFVNNKKTIYCGYKLNTHEQHYQQETISYLQGDFDKFLFNKISGRKITPTQRTRSLLFFCLATLTAISYNIKIIYLYENGVLSLNPEGYSRQTTKTTHPKTVYLFNMLLKNIGFDVKIEHPFLFKTKGEIIKMLDTNYKNIIKLTYTCGMSRLNRNYKSSLHCGVCIPCTLRKISLAAYDLEEYDREYEIPYGINVNETKYIHRGEYKSSNEYFRLIKRKIDNREIFNEIDLRPEYYEDSDYLSLTKELLTRFSEEVDVYYSKYNII
ncbi:7-cyano-7-deazaguanine synthase [Clostridium sp. BNL1100]|uniref:7-cyano-7-deazaguanine synthase n=1 Tax=Clostridium sp. BNL1100 TaxID=755731 RepID=UPI00024A7F36|nr:7-cyano-7-deazaguanine synthase [Clostridium sp. BNL1100]AEY65839.1 putative PP-loop superfamily ATPase [Clostridium sp. BNL1100]